jgi:hypothetical protein
MTIQNSKFKIQNSKSGAATLPSIIALTIFILAIGIGITAIGLSESLVSLGSSQSAQAFIFAEAGAKDALIRIARDKTYSGSYTLEFVSGGCSGSYEGCATVTISGGDGSASNPKIINSEGRMKSNKRTIRVSVEFDAGLYGEIATSTWQEITG